MTSTYTYICILLLANLVAVDLLPLLMYIYISTDKALCLSTVEYWGYEIIIYFDICDTMLVACTFSGLQSGQLVASSGLSVVLLHLRQTWSLAEHMLHIYHSQQSKVHVIVRLVLKVAISA
jgi:hypothetical protein